MPNVPNTAKTLRVSYIGITRKQKTLGYATQQVSSEDLERVRQTDLNNALVGKVSGIKFLGGSGAKFDAGRIVLRGTTSLSNAGGNYVSAYYYFSRKSLVFEDYVYDASYLKLRELSLSYDIPSSFLKKTKCGINKASISLIAQNPWLIYSGVPNIDPSESGSATNNFIEGGQAVSTRSFGCTVNITC